MMTDVRSKTGWLLLVTQLEGKVAAHKCMDLGHGCADRDDSTTRSWQQTPDPSLEAGQRKTLLEYHQRWSAENK